MLKVREAGDLVSSCKKGPEQDRCELVTNYLVTPLVGTPTKVAEQVALKLCSLCSTTTSTRLALLGPGNSTLNN